jgi:hypothetical protein
VLAHLLRTDADRHRPLPADSEQAAAIGVLARAHQDAVWTRARDVNRLRSLLREFFPAALTAFADLSTRTALRVLAAAPTPTAAAQLTEHDLRTLLGDVRVALPAARIRQLIAAFAAEQLHQPAQVEQAMGIAVQALVRTVTATSDAVAEIEDALAARFEHHRRRRDPAQSARTRPNPRRPGARRVR